MGPGWDIAAELEHFQRIWEYRSPGHAARHTRQSWDERAGEWERELRSGGTREREERRVAATADYLSSRGLLGADDEVIDVGCGPGRFVAEFAKSARRAVGTDISGKMLEYAGRFARQAGVENVSFVEADFRQADLDALGWRGRFDLVFSSLTPAIGGSGLRKLMELSRGWCFNSCFVHSASELEDELARAVLGCEPRPAWNNHWHWFYALFNLLLLEGYYPETRYYRESALLSVRPGADEARRWAKRLARDHGGDADALCAPVRAYLEKHAGDSGVLTRRDESVYGWILWNVTERAPR